MPQTNSNTNTLSGAIYDAHYTPLANVIVEAYDKDLRTEQLLTDASGHYVIKYGNAAYSKAEKAAAGIYVGQQPAN